MQFAVYDMPLHPMRLLSLSLYCLASRRALMGIDIDMPLTQGACKRLKSKMCVYYGPSPQKVLSDFSVDLNTGGLYLKTDIPLKIDDDLMLTFSLPGQEKSLFLAAPGSHG